MTIPRLLCILKCLFMIIIIIIIIYCCKCRLVCTSLLFVARRDRAIHVWDGAWRFAKRKIEAVNLWRDQFTARTTGLRGSTIRQGQLGLVCLVCQMCSLFVLYLLRMRSMYENHRHRFGPSFLRWIMFVWYQFYKASSR